MNVSDLGEFSLIERLTCVFADNYRPPESRADGRFQLLIGVGDDAAAWAGPPSQRTSSTITTTTTFGTITITTTVIGSGTTSTCITFSLVCH